MEPLQISLFNHPTPHEEGLTYEPLNNIYGKGIAIKPYRKIKTNGLDQLFPLEKYDYIMVGFSGGKDSIAAVLYLLELGVPKDKIILIHHLIDGKENDENKLLMDWPVTHEYCQQFADHMGLTIKYSWREKGFLGEILRLGSSNPISFEEFNKNTITTTSTDRWKITEKLLDELNEAQNNKDKEKEEEIMIRLKQYGYRFKFPAKSPSLTTRWCSSALKIEVFDRVLRYASLTESNCTLLFTDGIRREESSNRSKYNEMETHSCNASSKGRIIHSWRPVIEWSEKEVWEIIKKYHITPHPCYRLGWSRCSCAMCIFSQPHHFKGIEEVLPQRYNQLKQLEKKLGFTVDTKKDLDEYTKDAKSCVLNKNELLIKYSQGGSLPNNYIYSKEWELPIGAFHGTEGGPC